MIQSVPLRLAPPPDKGPASSPQHWSPHNSQLCLSVRPNIREALTVDRRGIGGSVALLAMLATHRRVSTQRQGASGLGLEAQRQAILAHVGDPARLVGEFVEVESGRRNDRPQLAAALAACRLHNATLVIAKLDRLARNVAFVSNLMESGVEFVACDVPQANRLTGPHSGGRGRARAPADLRAD